VDHGIFCIIFTNNSKYSSPHNSLSAYLSLYFGRYYRVEQRLGPLVVAGTMCFKKPCHLLPSIVSKVSQYSDNRSLKVQLSVSKSKSRTPNISVCKTEKHTTSQNMWCKVRRTQMVCECYSDKKENFQSVEGQKRRENQKN